MTTMTADDVAKVAAKILRDPDNVRWKPADHYDAINAGIVLIAGTRPESLCTTDETVADISDVQTGNAVLALAARWKPCLVQWVVHYLLQYHGGERENRERATQHLQNFNTLLQA